LPSHSVGAAGCLWQGQGDTADQAGKGAGERPCGKANPGLLGLLNKNVGKARTEDGGRELLGGLE